MRRSSLVILGVLFVFAALACIAYADSVVATVQFPFKAAGKDMAAGKYRIDATGEMEDLKITNEATGKALVVPYVSRLSEREGQTLLVFDKKGDEYFLSEIYFPGIDGFELKGATGKHTHVKVKATK